MSSGYFNKQTGYHNRQSKRLLGFDYSRSRYYFVTVCIHDWQQPLFGEIKVGTMGLNGFGRYATQCWNDIPNHFPNVKIDGFVVMPNHSHGILKLVDSTTVGTNDYSPTTRKQ